jgi:hypothetical protein
MTDFAVGVTVEQAQERISAMAPGTRLCYHIGFLLADRARRKVTLLADFMLRAGVGDAYTFSESSEPIAGLGLGYLTQEKISEGRYRYYFTKAA